MHDVIVIGGGPAGTSAAITAATAGLRVLLLERGSFPRHKVCGEFVSSESLNLLGDLLGPQHKSLLQQAIRITQARAFVDGQTIKTAVNPPAASIPRLDLDVALWASAEHSGVDARSQVVVHNISGASPFDVSTSVGDFESRAVINASGRWSNLTADPSRNAKSSEKWIGLKGHFSERVPNHSVDLYFFDGGYCGVQPVNVRDSPETGSRINACAMVRADVGTTLQEVFRQHPQLGERSRDWNPLGEPVSTSPLIFRDPRPECNGILMAGDAALFVDPFVGDGISLALRSGNLAAQSLTPFFRGELPLRGAALAYARVYQERLAPVFRASSLLRRMLELPRVVRAPMIYFVRAIPRLSRYLVTQTR